VAPLATPAAAARDPGQARPAARPRRHPAAVGPPVPAQRGRSTLPPRRAGGASSAGRRSTGDLRAGRQGAAQAASGARPAHQDAAVADRDDDGLKQRQAGDRGQREWISGGVPVGHLASAGVRPAPAYSSRLTAAPAHTTTASLDGASEQHVLGCIGGGRGTWWWSRSRRRLTPRPGRHPQACEQRRGEAADRDYHQLAAIGTGGGMDLKPGFRTANP
jgi:hypothetical protein